MTLTTGCVCLNFAVWAKKNAAPVMCLLFGIGCEVKCPNFIINDNRIQKIVLCSDKEIFVKNQPVSLCCLLWALKGLLSCTHFLIVKFFHENRINTNARNLRNQNVEIIQSDSSILSMFYSALVTISWRIYSFLDENGPQSRFLYCELI